MTIDSSKDYSTSSSSEESSWDISTSQQSGTTACCTPNSTISEPIPASLLQLADNPVARTPSIKKHLKQSVSIDEQSSNGMMMVAPLQTAGNDVNGITNKHDNKITAPNSDACAPTMISDVQIPDLSMFDLINQTSRLFVLKPATMGLKINCQIYRQKVHGGEIVSFINDLPMSLCAPKRELFIQSINSIWRIWTRIYC